MTEVRAPDHHDLRCPACDYNLRGLAEPRCPECGHRFQWETLLDASTRLHPYLFEHHPEQDFRAFWRTAWGGLLPWQFWESIRPQMSSRPRRMVIYWVAAMVVSALSIVAELAWGALLIWRHGAVAVRGRTWWDGQYLDMLMQYDQALRILIAIGVVNVLWPWLTWLNLRLLPPELRGTADAGWRTLRCALYSFDTSIWGSLIYIAAMPLSVIGQANGRGDFAILASVLMVVCYLFGLFRLAIGLRLHAGWRRPVLTTIVSQIGVAVCAWAAWTHIVMGQ
jgi:hypothetical protein